MGFNASIPLAAFADNQSDPIQNYIRLAQFKQQQQAGALNNQEARLKLSELVRKQTQDANIRSAAQNAVVPQQGTYTDPGMTLGGMTMPDRQVAVQGPNKFNQDIFAQNVQQFDPIMADQIRAQHEQQLQAQRESIAKAKAQDLDNIVKSESLIAQHLGPYVSAPPEVQAREVPKVMDWLVQNKIADPNLKYEGPVQLKYLADRVIAAKDQAEQRQQALKDAEAARHNTAMEGSKTVDTAAGVMQMNPATGNYDRRVGGLPPKGNGGNGLPGAPQEIKTGTPAFRTAQDLAYGKLTFSQFRTLVAYSRDPNLKMGIYQKAAELNPNFNPATFEMGFKFASNPATQKALAAVDNVMPNIDKIIELSNSIPRTDLPSVNSFLNSAKFHLGNTQVSNFRQAQKLVGDELGVALGAGAMTDMKLQLGLDVVDPNVSPQVFFSNMQRVKEFLANRKQSLINQMGIYGQPGMNSGNDSGQPGAQQPTQPKVRVYNPATGRLE